MRHKDVQSVAMGGVFAALATVIMCLGGLIPVATYICPMLCALLLAFIFQKCGKRIAWAWYVAVSILSLLLGPDKEAAVVFVFLGYYPIIKPWIDKRKLPILWKVFVFNLAVVTMYALMLWVFRLDQVLRDFTGVGIILMVVMLLMGNIALFMLDFLLGRISLIKKPKK
jgi:hypothetical protein